MIIALTDEQRKMLKSIVESKLAELDMVWQNKKLPAETRENAKHGYVQLADIRRQLSQSQL